MGVEVMRQVGRRRRAFALAAFVGATLLAAPASAHAQLPGGPGAVDQYVEDVPTGGGKTHPTKDAPTKTSVPASVQAKIEAQGGSDAPLLTEVVSSSSYGAPQDGRPTRMERGGATADGGPSPEESAGVLSSAVSAVEGGDSRRLLGLLAALLAVSVATVVAVGVRQRRGVRP
jgi:hypothetical protein